METVIVLRGPRGTARSEGAHGGIRGRRSASDSTPRVEVERVDRRGRSELLAEPDLLAVGPAMPTRLIEPRAVRAVDENPSSSLDRGASDASIPSSRVLGRQFLLEDS